MTIQPPADDLKNNDTPPSEVLAVLYISPIRKWLTITTLVIFGFILSSVVVTQPPKAVSGQIFLIGLSMMVLLGAFKMVVSQPVWLELTHCELRENTGRVLSKVKNISQIETGRFVFKPSNGFTVRLYKNTNPAWRLGLYWCFGKTIGVGGSTVSNETKYMSEALSALVLKRA